MQSPGGHNTRLTHLCFQPFLGPDQQRIGALTAFSTQKYLLISEVTDFCKLYLGNWALPSAKGLSVFASAVWRNARDTRHVTVDGELYEVQAERALNGAKRRCASAGKAHALPRRHPQLRRVA